MNRIKLVKFAGIAALATTGLVLPLSAAQANSQPQPITCMVNSVGTSDSTGHADSRFAVADGEVSAKFIVAGNADCRENVTLATWEAPNAGKGQPYSAQKLFDHTTKTNLKPGTYTISTKLPDCFFQVDLLRGTNATAPDGGPVYPAGWLMGSLHGGNNVCATASPSPTPTPVVIVTPAPVATPAVEAASTTLPDTGSSLSGLVGLSALAGTGYAYLRSRRAARA